MKETFFIAKAIAKNFKEKNVQAVIGLANSGTILSELVAYQLGKLLNGPILSFYVEKGKTGAFVLRDESNKNLIKNKRVLLVDDAVNTGKTARTLSSFVIGLGAKIVGMGVVCSRNPMTANKLKIPKFYSFMTYANKINSYPAKNCPLCKRNIPIDRNFGAGT